MGITVGGTPVAAIQVGATPVQRVMVGGTQVWPDTPALPDAPVLTIENIRSETVERAAAARAVYDAAAGTGKSLLEFAEAALATAPIRAFVGYSSMSNVGGMGATTGKVPQIAAAHQSIKTPAFVQFESDLAAFRQDVIDGKVVI